MHTAIELVFSKSAVVALGALSLLSLAACTASSEDGATAGSAEDNLTVGPSTFPDVATPAFPLAGYYEITDNSCFEGEATVVNSTWRLVSDAAGVRSEVLTIDGSTPISDDRWVGWAGQRNWETRTKTDIYGGIYRGRYESGNASFVWTQRVGTVTEQDETWSSAGGKVTLERQGHTCKFAPITREQAKENASTSYCAFTPCTVVGR